MEKGIWLEIEELYKEFQQLGISQWTMRSTTSILLLPILQPLRVLH